MIVIKKIIEHMRNTLEEAQDYYEDFILYKEEHPKIAQYALDMAKAHVEMYNKWHDAVVSLISEYKQKNNKEVPIEMKAIWDFEHSILVKDFDELRYKISKVQ